MTRSASYRPLGWATLALAAALASAPYAAFAQMRGNFDDADTNHDGRVTLQEYEAYVTNRLQSAHGPRAERFKEMSPDQQAALLQKRFDAHDKGHKGYLDRNDWNGDGS